MLDVEPDTQERFHQVDELIHRLDESLRQTQHMFTEHIAQSKQIQAQHSTMISRFDNILMGDGQTHGTLVRMANLEQSTVSLHSGSEHCSGSRMFDRTSCNRLCCQSEHSWHDFRQHGKCYSSAHDWNRLNLPRDSHCR